MNNEKQEFMDEKIMDYINNLKKEKGNGKEKNKARGEEHDVDGRSRGRFCNSKN